MKRTSEEVPPPLYPRPQPLLRDVVQVCFFTPTGIIFNVYLTRVPAVGEDVAIGATIYRVSQVQHCALEQDGRSRFGSHASVDVVEIAEPERPPVKPRGKRKAKPTLEKTVMTVRSA